MLWVSLVSLFCSCFSSLRAKDTFFMKGVLGMNAILLIKKKNNKKKKQQKQRFLLKGWKH